MGGKEGGEGRGGKILRAQSPPPLNPFPLRQLNCLPYKTDPPSAPLSLLQKCWEGGIIEMVIGEMGNERSRHNGQGCSGVWGEGDGGGGVWDN